MYFLGRFVCINCEKTYLRKQTLRRHMMYECGKKPSFICGICFKSFKRKDSLQCHMLMTHHEKH